MGRRQSHSQTAMQTTGYYDKIPAIVPEKNGRENILESYLIKEWPAVAIFLRIKSAKKNISPAVVQLQRAEEIKREEIRAKIREVYGTWYKQIDFVDGQFSSLAQAMIEYTEVPGWNKFFDYYLSPHYRSMSGYGYEFASGVGYALGKVSSLDECGKKIIIRYPETPGKYLGDERSLGLDHPNDGGPLSDPFAMFTYNDPDLERMIRGANSLVANLAGHMLRISASDETTELDVMVPSDRIVPSLQAFSLNLIFNRLMIAINANDLKKYGERNNVSQLLLKPSNIGVSES